METDAAVTCSIQWGDLGEWLFGLATVGALVWAVLETRHSRKITAASLDQTERALAMQADRDRHDADSRLKRQAALVSCMVEARPLDRSIVIWNHSDAPIFDVEWFVVTAAGSPSMAGTDQRFSVIGADSGDSTGIAIAPDLATRVDRLTGITFRDTAGVEWVKWCDGRLEIRSSTVGDFTQQIAGDAAWARRRDQT